MGVCTCCLYLCVCGWTGVTQVPGLNNILSQSAPAYKQPITICNVVGVNVRHPGHPMAHGRSSRPTGEASSHSSQCEGDNLTVRE